MAEASFDPLIPGRGMHVRAASLLRLPATLARWLEVAAADGYPEEICGLLVGRTGQDGTAVLRVTRGGNLDHIRRRDRYALDPRHYLAVDAVARAEGLDVVGVWHTHPDHPAWPSPTDHAAAWPGLSYVIVSVTRTGETEVRAFRLDGAAFVEQPFVELGSRKKEERR